MTNPPADRSLIYGDDSSKIGPKFFVYGSWQFSERRLAGIEKKLRHALGDYPHEIKWNETRHLAVNVRFLNALFESFTSLSYRCIVVPNRQIKEAASGSERALLRAKLVFTHLNTYRKNALLDRPKFYVTLDKDEFDPEVQAITLNRRFWKENGNEKGSEAFEVRGEHSHEHLLLQAADLVTGAVAWVTNGGLETTNKSNAFVHRHTLATIIARRARLAAIKVEGLDTIPQGDVRLLGHQTVPWHERGFSIWHIDLTKGRGAVGRETQ